MQRNATPGNMMLAMTGAVLLFAGNAVADQSHNVQFSRSFAPGQRFHVQTTGNETRQVSAFVYGGEQVLQNTEIEVEFDANAEVIAVDGNGWPTEMSFVVSECTMSSNGKEQTIARRGSTMTATFMGSETEFQIDGRDVDGKIEAALNLVANLAPMSENAQDMFGTSQPRQVGDSWQINRNRAASEWSRKTDLPVTSQDVSGRASVLDVQSHQGQTCMLIGTQMTLANIFPQRADYPSDYSVEKSELSWQTQQLLPVDRRLPAFGESMKMQQEAILAGKLGDTGAPVELHINSSRSVKRSITLNAATIASVTNQ